jgi:hypothetical protein
MWYNNINFHEDHEALLVVLPSEMARVLAKRTVKNS